MKMNSSDLLKLMILIFVFILTYLFFSSLLTILSEEKPFNPGYHVAVDNKI